MSARTTFLYKLSKAFRKSRAHLLGSYEIGKEDLANLKPLNFLKSKNAVQYNTYIKHPVPRVFLVCTGYFRNN